MRIGIVGAGIAGMAAAWMLQAEHSVTLFDEKTRLGGHVETKEIAVDGSVVHAELGTRWFFDASYPYFLALLEVLRVPRRWVDTRVSFTDRQRGYAVVMPPRSLRHLAVFARDPRVLRHVLSLRRIIEDQPEVSRQRDYSISFRRYLEARGYPPAFGPEFAYPFLAGCWGVTIDNVAEFPAYSLLKGMPPGTHPGHYEIDGGMTRYIRALADDLAGVDVRLGTRVRRISRRERFIVEDTLGSWDAFDHIVVATSAFDATRLLAGLSSAKRMEAAIAAFDPFDVEIVVHGDASLMPDDPRDWCDTNLFLDGGAAWMSEWQGIRTGAPVFRTWLPRGHPLPSPLYAHRLFHHVLMRSDNAVLQRRIAAAQGEDGLWVTGMYSVDVDNHESALLSALVPVLALAPRSRNLRRLIDKVSPDAVHDHRVLLAPELAQRREHGSLSYR